MGWEGWGSGWTPSGDSVLGSLLGVQGLKADVTLLSGTLEEYSAGRGLIREISMVWEQQLELA